MTLQMPDTSRYGQALIGPDDYPAICAAWWITPLMQLGQGPAVTWENRDDGEDGFTEFNGIGGEVTGQFSLVMIGGVDRNGDPQTGMSAEVGLLANYDDFVAHICGTSGKDILWMPTGTEGGYGTRSGRIQFDTPDLSPKGAVLRTTLGYRLPRGPLVAVP